MKNNQLYAAYIQIIEQENKQIINESITQQLWNKLLSMFKCFDNTIKLSNKISTGNWDGNLQKLKTDGQSALNEIDNEFSMLKPVSKKIKKLGQNNSNTLIKKPLTTIINGGDLDKSVQDALNNSKNQIAVGMQTALTNQQVTTEQTNEILQKVKTLNIKPYIKEFQQGYINFIKQEVNNYNNNQASIYENINQNISIKTSNGYINIFKNNKKLILEETISINNTDKSFTINASKATNKKQASIPSKNAFRKTHGYDKGSALDKFNTKLGTQPGDSIWKKIWALIKFIYRPLYNLMCKICSLILNIFLKLFWSIGWFILQLINHKAQSKTVDYIIDKKLKPYTNVKVTLKDRG